MKLGIRGRRELSAALAATRTPHTQDEGSPLMRVTARHSERSVWSPPHEPSHSYHRTSHPHRRRRHDRGPRRAGRRERGRLLQEPARARRHDWAFSSTAPSTAPPYLKGGSNFDADHGQLKVNGASIQRSRRRGDCATTDKSIVRSRHTVGGFGSCAHVEWITASLRTIDTIHQPVGRHEARRRRLRAAGPRLAGCDRQRVR